MPEEVMSSVNAATNKRAKAYWYASAKEVILFNLFGQRPAGDRDSVSHAVTRVGCYASHVLDSNEFDCLEVCHSY